jgi:hypothetical protein
VRSATDNEDQTRQAQQNPRALQPLILRDVVFCGFQEIQCGETGIVTAGMSGRAVSLSLFLDRSCGVWTVGEFEWVAIHDPVVGEPQGGSGSGE